MEVFDLGRVFSRVSYVNPGIFRPVPGVLRAPTKEKNYSIKYKNKMPDEM